MASIDEIRDAVREGTMDGLRDVAKVVVHRGSQMIEDRATDRNSLLESVEVREVPDELTVYVSWTAEHSVYVHYGTGPARGRAKYWPSKPAIRDWVERNLRARQEPAQDGSAVFVFKPEIRAGTRKPREKELETMTFLVMRKIHDHGTDPVPFATTGAAEARDGASDKVRRGVNDALRRLG